MTIKPQTDYANFAALDIRVGKIIKVEDAESKKPTYRMTVDFGSEIGIKISCGAYRNYAKEDLVGRLVVGVMNLGTRKMGPEISEFLTLGAPNAAGETIYLMPAQNVELGAEVF
jgi:tRNA-binding protein